MLSENQGAYCSTSALNLIARTPSGKTLQLPTFASSFLQCSYPLLNHSIDTSTIPYDPRQLAAMTTYQEKDLENLMCSPGPAVPFNGGYGANPTSQAPYAIYDTAAMYYPNHYQSNPYAVQQDHLQIPWSSAEPVSSMQWSPQQLQNTPDINSNYNSCVFDNTQYLQTSFMTQTTPVLSSNSSFMTPSRKVLISRPAKCSWDFSTSHLHSMVMCCIARLSAEEYYLEQHD